MTPKLYSETSDRMSQEERNAAWAAMTPEEQQEARVRRGLLDGEYVIRGGTVVCSTCGGNCGQCGNTGTLGNVPFDFALLVSNVKNGTRLQNERPRRWWEFWR